MKRIICRILILILFAGTACSRSGVEWNEEDNSLKSAGLSYEMYLPEWGKWVFMEEASSPQQVEFCVVSQDTGVAAMLCVLDTLTDVSSALSRDISLPYVERIVGGQGAFVRSTELTEGQCAGSAAYKFRCDVSLADGANPADTMNVSYVGYLFDHGPRRYALVTTVVTDIIDTFSDSALDDVFSGLRFVD